MRSLQRSHPKCHAIQVYEVQSEVNAFKGKPKSKIVIISDLNCVKLDQKNGFYVHSILN